MCVIFGENHCIHCNSKLCYYPSVHQHSPSLNSQIYLIKTSTHCQDHIVGNTLQTLFVLSLQSDLGHRESPGHLRAGHRELGISGGRGIRAPDRQSGAGEQGTAAQTRR